MHILYVRTVELGCRYKNSAESRAFAFSQINVEGSEVILSHIHPTLNRRHNNSLQQWLTTSLKAGKHWIQIRFYFGLNNIFRDISLSLIICLIWIFCFLFPHLSLYWCKTACNLRREPLNTMRPMSYTPTPLWDWCVIHHHRCLHG